jgi:DNA-binding winged helix-turn-helix (wHTH) protein/Tol biopolymer transport system component
VKNGEGRLRFGGFTLDLRLRALARGDERVRLTPKPLETLVFLVEHRGRVVSKEALLAAVWKDAAVTDGVLVQAVREIRRALDDDRQNPSFIQTVPREGYRFVGDVVTEEPATRQRTVAALSPNVPAAARWPLRVLGIVAVIVLALIVGRFWTSGREPPTKSAENGEAPARVAPVTAAGISAVKPVFSPDGKALLYLSDAPEADGALDLFLLPLNSGDPWRLTHKVNAAGDLPVFTADSREVVFARYRTGGDGSLPDLWKVSSFGGTAVRYVPEASGAGFSPDGAWIAFTRHAPSGRTLMLSPVDRIEDAWEVSTPGFTPRWSPDGRWLAYTTSYPEGGDGHVWIVSPSLAVRRRLTHEAHQLYGLAWSADSGSIVFAAKVGNAFHLWRASMTNGSIEPLTTGVGEYVSPTVSPDGRLLAFTLVHPVRDLEFAHPVGSDHVAALSDNEHHRWPRLSPFGRRIASVAQRSTVDDYLYITDVETRESRRVSDVPAEYPSWIGEDLVAYLTPPRSDSVEIRQVDLRSGENSTLARLAVSASWLAMRPGAPQAAFVITSGDRRRILLRDLASGRESIIAEGLEFAELRWRPDGKLLAWSGPRVWADAHTNGVCIVEPGRSAPRRVVANGYGPAWTADGALFFLRYFGDRDEAGIWRMDPESGLETQVRRVARVDYFDVAGESLVFARNTGRAQVYSMPLR